MGYDRKTRCGGSTGKEIRTGRRAIRQVELRSTATGRGYVVIVGSSRFYARGTDMTAFLLDERDCVCFVRWQQVSASSKKMGGASSKEEVRKRKVSKQETEVCQEGVAVSGEIEGSSRTEDSSSFATGSV